MTWQGAMACDTLNSFFYNAPSTIRVKTTGREDPFTTAMAITNHKRILYYSQPAHVCIENRSRHLRSIAPEISRRTFIYIYYIKCNLAKLSLQLISVYFSSMLSCAQWNQYHLYRRVNVCIDHKYFIIFYCNCNKIRNRKKRPGNIFVE